MKYLKKNPSFDQNKKINRAYKQFEKLLSELKKKNLPKEIITSINEGIDQINAVSESERAVKKQLRQSKYSKID